MAGGDCSTRGWSSHNHHPRSLLHARYRLPESTERRGRPNAAAEGWRKGGVPRPGDAWIPTCEKERVVDGTQHSNVLTPCLNLIILPPLHHLASSYITDTETARDHHQRHQHHEAHYHPLSRSCSWGLCPADESPRPRRHASPQLREGMCDVHDEDTIVIRRRGVHCEKQSPSKERTSSTHIQYAGLYTCTRRICLLFALTHLHLNAFVAPCHPLPTVGGRRWPVAQGGYGSHHGWACRTGRRRTSLSGPR